jgi:hypothetical protein
VRKDRQRRTLWLSPSHLLRGSRASDGAVALDARNKSEHDKRVAGRRMSAICRALAADILLQC